jgi:hypothetical protein
MRSGGLAAYFEFCAEADSFSLSHTSGRALIKDLAWLSYG